MITHLKQNVKINFKLFTIKMKGIDKKFNPAWSKDLLLQGRFTLYFPNKTQEEIPSGSVTGQNQQ